MKANVNATRMEMLSLRRRVELAKRGHKLLSQKRDELSRQLVKIARMISPLRKERFYAEIHFFRPCGQHSRTDAGVACIRTRSQVSFVLRGKTVRVNYDA